MPSVAADKRAFAGPGETGWLRPALVVVLAVTALRVLLLAFDRTDLFVDEAQYWFWGQELAFGYYSKPPLIGWVIALCTGLAGSDATFWIRLPGALFNAATALLLGAVAARVYGRRAAVWVAAGFVSLPMVALGSLLISTDTIMFPFLAAALLAWVVLLQRGGQGDALALAAGAALGLGFMAKYAAVYYLGCAVLVAFAVPGARPSRRAALLALLAFAVVISPNIIWNAVNEFPTLKHTADNVGWVRNPEARAGLHSGNLLGFVASQFAVFGPVPFALMLWLALRWRQLSGTDRAFLLFALPVVGLVSLQALLSRAYANWAVAAFVAGSVPVFALAARRRWLGVSALVLNGVVCLALPLATLFPDAIHFAGRPALARYLGRAAVSEAILARAQSEGLNRVVAESRDVLAELFYIGRDSGLTFYAAPPNGCDTDDDCVEDHYEMTHPMPDNLTGEVLFATSAPSVGCAPGATPVEVLAPRPGTWQKAPIQLFRVPGTCWNPKR